MIHRAPFAALVVALGLALVCGPPHDAAETPAAAPAPEPQVTAPMLGNPPAPGFDEAGSDRRAIELADRVMARLGGRSAWDGTWYLTK